MSGIAGMSVQHLSEIESSKRDPRLSSIERIADAMELAVMLVPGHMAPDIRRISHPKAGCPHPRKQQRKPAMTTQLSFSVREDTDDSAKSGCLLSTQHSNLSTVFGTFSKDWTEEDELDELIDTLEAGRISHKQGLLRAQKLLIKFPGQLEIQNFIANRLWSLKMRDESTDVREKAYRQASALIPPGCRSFLRTAHGYLLGLMHRGFPDVRSALSPQHSVLLPCAHAAGRHQHDDRQHPKCHEKLSARSHRFTGALIPGGPNCVS